MRTEHLTPAIGSIVHGADLTQEWTEAKVGELKRLLAERQVIFFRDQDLSAEAQLKLASLFGAPVASPHPKFGCVDNRPEVSLVINDESNPPDINVWHSDLTFQEKPATVCVLHCRDLPDAGGDTLWSSMIRAYETLSAPMRSFIDPLTAYHQLPLDGYPPEKIRGAVSGPIAARHPVVRYIRETGKKSLFVNRVYAQRIEELTRTESRGVLAALFDHAESPDHQVRFRWSRGAVAIWDNRTTQHFAAADYFPHRRVMHRVAVEGEAVIAANSTLE